MNVSVVTVAVAALTLSACACFTDGPGDSKSAQSSPAAVASYDCGARGVLTVKWTPDMAEVNASRGSWLLPRARSSSGARYADSRRELWEHQGALRWTDAGADPVICNRHTAG